MRAFILTPTYRVRDGKPEVHLYGVLESGEPCLIVDDRVRPHFFIRAVDRARTAAISPRTPLEETELRTFAGEPVVRVTLDFPADVPPLRKRLETAGVACFEADVRFAYRYLIDRGIRGAVLVRGRFGTAPQARTRLSQPRPATLPLGTGTEGVVPGHRNRPQGPAGILDCPAHAGAVPRADRTRARLAARRAGGFGARPDPALPKLSRRARSRHHHGLERRRLRPGRLGAHRASLRHPLCHRAQRGRLRPAARCVLHARIPCDRLRPSRPRRPVALARRLHPPAGLQARDRRAGAPRSRQAHRRKRSRGGDRARVSPRSAALRRLQPRRCSPGGGDSRSHRLDRPRRAAQPAHRHAAGPGERRHRLRRLALPRFPAPDAVSLRRPWRAPPLGRASPAVT